MVKLSKRLQAVADLVSIGYRVCDVGTDHGYIPIWLVAKHRAPSALAMDVNDGPLLRAQEHIAQEGWKDYIVTRKSDGLMQLGEAEADSVIIAGMGGGLMIRILEDSIDKIEAVKEFVLQPQSDIELVRKWVREHGMFIEAQQMVEEDGKYYSMFRCVHSNEKEYKNVEDINNRENCDAKLQKIYDRYGKQLVRQNHPVLAEYLDKEEAQLHMIKKSLLAQKDSQAAAVRRQEVEEKLELISLTRCEMEKK